MRTLFSKILLAQVVTVILALAVVTVITRISLHRGLKEFLETQETAVLGTLTPVLSELYAAQGGWAVLRNDPAGWARVLRLTREQTGGRPQRDGRLNSGRLRANAQQPADAAAKPLLHLMRPHERGMLFRRLFLLDQDQVRIAGAANYDSKGLYLESIEHEGRVVGWIGFTPMGNALPPDAKRFLSGQVRILVVSFALALVVAAALAYLLAGNVSRPVRQLVEKVSQLSRGEYQARAAVETRDEIGSLASHVNELAQTLEKNRTARQRWMADIAHELRTPVSILKGEIEAMIDGVRQADEQTTTSLHEEVNHLSKLVDDLQALALSDAGALNIRKEKVDLSALTAQAADAFATRLAQRQISLQAYPDKGVTLIGDPHRLRQLLHNLLQNCYGYVESGGRVRVLLMRSAGSAELVLEDSGPGVAEDQLEHLFDRFYRGDSSRSRSLGGSGLGLSICKNIVEAHGGAILARQSDLGGLKIRILLPG